MRKRITNDKRYKVSQKIVNEIRDLRKQKLSYQKIADKYNLSLSTIKYWTNDDYREKMRIKNAKRKSLKKENMRRIELMKRDSKTYTRENCLGYIHKYVMKVKYKPKEKQYRLFGQDVDFWDNILETEKKGLIKVN